MSQLIVRAGDFIFQARFEEEIAPKTCAAFRKAVPFTSRIIDVRWSGEAVWMPLGDLDFGVTYENHTSYPDRIGRSAESAAGENGSKRNVTRWLPAGTTTARNRSPARRIGADVPSISATQPG